jgi:hypothetical protein
MSVTIHVLDDTDLSVNEEFDCVCNGKNKSCSCCHGTGKDCLVGSKYDMNMANQNFNTLWNSLGLNPDDFIIDPDVLLNAIKSFDPKLAVRRNQSINKSDAGENSTTDNTGKWIDLGFPIESIIRRQHQLKAIALHAKKLGKKIVWG